MSTAIVATTYERAKLIARNLDIDDARLCSAHSLRAMDGLLVDRWLVESGVAPEVVDIAKRAMLKRPGATVEFVRLGRRSRRR